MAVQSGEGRPTYMRAFAPFVVGAVIPMVIGAILFASLGHATPDHTALDHLRDEEGDLRRQLLQLREDLSRRRLACRPPAVQTAVVPPVEAPAAPVETPPEQPAPSVAEAPPGPVEPPKPQQLMLPEESIKQKKLDFLEGCWLSDNNTIVERNTKKPVRYYYCFLDNGTGRFIVKEDNGDMICKGDVKGRISNNVIKISGKGSARCNSPGRYWDPDEVVCKRDDDGRALCEGKNRKGQWTAHFTKVERPDQ